MSRDGQHLSALINAMVIHHRNAEKAAAAGHHHLFELAARDYDAVAREIARRLGYDVRELYTVVEDAL